MDREQIRHQRIALAYDELKNWDGKSGHWYWLSFADEEGFHGACIVKAPSLLTAVPVAHIRGCKSHGQVLFGELDHVAEAVFHPKWSYRLLSRAEAEQFDEELGKQPKTSSAKPKD